MAREKENSGSSVGSMGFIGPEPVQKFFKLCGIKLVANWGASNAHSSVQIRHPVPTPTTRELKMTRRMYVVDGDDVDLAAFETALSYMNNLHVTGQQKNVLMSYGLNGLKFFDQNGLPLGQQDENGNFLIPTYEGEPIAMENQKGLAIAVGN